MNACTQHDVSLVSLPFVCLSPLECDLSLSRSRVLFLPLVDTCTYQAKVQRLQLPLKTCYESKDAEMQKLQEYSKQIEKML
jgi:hypothetical protein